MTDGIFAHCCSGNNGVMNPPQGYLDGRIVPVSEMAISVTDAGFTLGTTVTEQMRTFAGNIFELEKHLQRLERSLKIVGIEPRESLRDLAEIAQNLVQRNHLLFDAQDDLGLTLFVTPGPLPRFNDGKRGAPCVGMHTFPLPFHLWNTYYHQGQPLSVTEIEQVSPQCWPAELKCRSRMHYYLADQSATRTEPGSRALLLDSNHRVIEASTANIILYKNNQGILTPPVESALPGISLLYVQKLAQHLGLDWKHCPIVPEDVAQADEVFLSSTPFCLLPVTSLNRQPIQDGQPGPLFQQLATAWSECVRVDFIQQAGRFADRSNGEAQ